MLAENLKALRKAKGLSQEELAARLHVVRQTVSKWEKGRSVPDADLLIRLAEELDTTSAALLGPEVPPEAERGGTAEQLARIAEQLAVKNRRARRNLEDRGRGADRLCDGQFIVDSIELCGVPQFPGGGRIHCPSAGTPARRVVNLYCKKFRGGGKQNASRRRCLPGRPCQATGSSEKSPAASIVSIKIPYPLLGSFSRTCVTAPANFPSCRIGLPDIPWTMPPVAARSSGSVTEITRSRPSAAFSTTCKISTSYS